jgi:hypothetical protein
MRLIVIASVAPNSARWTANGRSGWTVATSAEWFQDPRDERFHELSWRHAREVERPFGASALGYVKRLLVESGMHRPSEEEIATGLARLLHELSDEDLFRDRRARREAVRQAVIAEQRRSPARTVEKPAGPAQAKLPDAWSGIDIPTLELER